MKFLREKRRSRIELTKRPTERGEGREEPVSLPSRSQIREETSNKFHLVSGDISQTAIENMTCDAIDEIKETRNKTLVTSNTRSKYFRKDRISIHKLY